ncbi:MAG: hypothetical protein ACK4UY_12410 [Dietzia sp.]
MSFDTVFWVAPPGATAVVDVTGDGADTAELQWSTRCAEVPSTRAVVLIDGPGNEDSSVDFGTAHSVAEKVAEFVTDRTGVEAGPIEVLVFRPDHAAWPEPAPVNGGASFRFRHRGGADVHVALTLPALTLPASTPPASTPPISTPPVHTTTTTSGEA